MEWSKDKTLRLIDLMQMNATLWNPSLCDTRRDKQKRKEELRAIATHLRISVGDATKKIQHLRTQYNRESARESRAYAEDPHDRYISNWYAFEYLHFLKDASKPYRVMQPDDNQAAVDSIANNSDNSIGDCKLDNLSPPHKVPKIESLHSIKPELVFPANLTTRDEFSVFGEYVANELRSLKGEKNLLVAKKKIQDVIFELKMGLISEPKPEQSCTVYGSHSTQPHNTTIHNGKIYTTPVMSSTSQIDPLTSPHMPPRTGINEIIINSACHYSNFKVDAQ